jgi:hypothetical protein
VEVLKAARKFRAKSDRANWRTMHGVADKNTPRFISTLVNTTDGIRRKVSGRALTAAVASGNMAAIEQALLLNEMDEQLRRKYRRQIQETLNEAGIAMVKRQPKPLASVFGSFDKVNPRAVDWANTKAAKLVAEVSESQKRTIRRVVAQGIEQGVPVRESARRLRSSIGLTERQWNSVSNFQNKMIDRGLSAAEAAKRADVFARRKHRQRAETIARTETIDASIQGQTELWRQAVDKGLINEQLVQKKWIVTPDDLLDSVICLPMAGVEVGLNEDFILPDGRAVEGPTAHPRCRCAVRLKLPGRGLFNQNRTVEEQRAIREANIPLPT